VQEFVRRDAGGAEFADNDAGSSIGEPRCVGKRCSRRRCEREHAEHGVAGAGDIENLAPARAAIDSRFSDARVRHFKTCRGNMQRLQREWTQRGVIWLTVISSAPGKQGYVTAADENSWLKQINAAPTAALLDPMGTLGHLYDAKTTPQMFVINPQGTLAYDGAIDDKPTTDWADIGRAKNYLSQALEEGMAGKAVSTPTSRPYGCSVKYPGSWF